MTNSKDALKIMDAIEGKFISQHFNKIIHLDMIDARIGFLTEGDFGKDMDNELFNLETAY
jgi:hypothetical protein